MTWGSQSGVEPSLLLSDGRRESWDYVEFVVWPGCVKLEEILGARFQRDRYLEVIIIVLLLRAERQGGGSGRARGCASGLPALLACKGGSTGWVQLSGQYL